jgi:hypothetical protein
MLSIDMPPLSGLQRQPLPAVAEYFPATFPNGKTSLCCPFGQSFSDCTLLQGAATLCPAVMKIWLFKSLGNRSDFFAFLLDGVKKCKVRGKKTYRLQKYCLPVYPAIHPVYYKTIFKNNHC